MAENFQLYKNDFGFHGNATCKLASFHSEGLRQDLFSNRI